ncbi:MAG: class I SAM-dependent methyltransferase [Bacteroidia bacterium]
MQINTNRWNRFRYALYSPLYDFVVGSFTQPMRKKSLANLHLPPGSKILLIGAGTGLDLPYLPEHLAVTAIDITPAMLHKLQRKAKRLNLQVETHLMDGHHLHFPDAIFDAVVLHFIIAVIPDPVACIREAERVLKPGGTVFILDKFLPDHAQPNLFRRIMNPLANLVATDINRRAGEILAKTNLVQIAEVPMAFNGTFKSVKAKKPE